MDGVSELERALAAADARVAAATVAAGRPVGSVQLLLATKTIGAQPIRQAIEAGFGLIGENRVQELVAKAPDLADLPHRTHLIGHLQSNKVGVTLPLIDCLQSLDSVELAHKIQRRLESADRTLDVLLQANVSGEPGKSGVPLEELPALLAGVAACDRLIVRGYMTIGLNSPDLDAVRAGYRALADFRDRARAQGLPGAQEAVELSMGMSGDAEAAIAEGATIVRMGSAVFGARKPQGPPARPVP